MRPVTAPVGWQYDQPNFGPAQAMTKTELAYVRLRQQILEGELAPGQPLDPLAAAFAASQATAEERELMEALSKQAPAGATQPSVAHPSRGRLKISRKYPVVEEL